MATQDYDAKSEKQLEIKYYRDKLIAYDSNLVDDVGLLYGNAAKLMYFDLVNQNLIVEGEGGGGGGGAVDSVAGKTGVVTLVKADVGLNLVDNTADNSKPVSAAQQAALDAKAGTSHNHTLSQLTDASSLGRQIASTADAASARTLIGAGTSNLALGTSGSTAKAGNYAPTIADLPAGTEVHVYHNGSSWPARPTARTDIPVVWTAPRSVTTTPSDKVNGKDIREFSGD